MSMDSANNTQKPLDDVESMVKAASMERRRAAASEAVGGYGASTDADMESMRVGMELLARAAAAGGGGGGQAADMNSLLSNLMSQLAVSAPAGGTNGGFRNAGGYYGYPGQVATEHYGAADEHENEHEDDHEHEREWMGHRSHDQSPACVAGPMQMIGGDGTFFEQDVDHFITSSEDIPPASADYAVVSIIGAQSSGKSFLLNCLFGTSFKVMNAEKGRRQTTKGMWLSRCVRPSLLILDVEGSDGRERGEDDTSFEKQSALFALTISDLMMVNMWLRDIGREQGGSIPLLRTVFRERAKLDPGRTKVLVIIRGYDHETPFDTLVDDVVTSMEELWKSVHDQPGRPRVLFRDYIEVSVVALPDKIQEQKFKREVVKLREWFATHPLVGFRQDKVSASGFSISAKGIWETIRQNKRLNLPAHRVMVSSFFCEKIVKESINSLESREDYLSLKKGMQTPKEFSEKLGSLLKLLLTHFDTETEMYDAKERAVKRQELEDEVLHHMESICRDLLYELRLRTSSESKDKITNLFSNADDPSMIIDQSVEDCLKKYLESCEDLSTRYKDLCDDNCKVLKSELLSFAKIMAERIEDLRMREEAEHARDEAEQKARFAKEEAELAKEEAEREAQRIREETERLIEQERREAELARQEAANRARQEAELEAKTRELNDPLLGLLRLAGAIGRSILVGYPAGVGGILDPTMQNRYAPANHSTSRGFEPPYPTMSHGYEPPYPPMSHDYGPVNPITRHGYEPPYPTANHGYEPATQGYPTMRQGYEPSIPKTSRGYEPSNPTTSLRNNPAYTRMGGGYEPTKPVASHGNGTAYSTARHGNQADNQNRPSLPAPPPRNLSNLPGSQPAKPIPARGNLSNLPGSQPAEPIPAPRNPAKPIPAPRKLPK